MSKGIIVSDNDIDTGTPDVNAGENVVTETNIVTGTTIDQTVTTNDDWASLIPQAVREMEGFRDVKDAQDFVRRVEELRRGPELPEKYHIEVPEGLTLDSKVETGFQAAAKAAKLTQDQAATMVKLWNELQANAVRDFEYQTEKLREQVVDKWGNEFDGNIAHAKRALNTYGSDELKALLDSTGLGNHPVVVETFYKIGKAMGEDTAIVGGKPQPELQRGLGGLPMLNFNM